ncbi:hypothetical protein ABEF95_014000 [Exophiala dermatitidis]|uniref:Uncharacterized protein n=1 Tax=Exophiala dermatitidis (strain ATCC 34100 / CBS 525.76 / NIH/UT8656) TaxID=858893 RepID=H6BK87_EXODN|nr:uncharacterized protein HMPREF1120_00733 [Exophiala dermatitidis NIH/UT8656]EHY52522.1 hypothetical protein HMPREF1120_00733 [Exophiala dermatitidis NIH/UT8656]
MRGSLITACVLVAILPASSVLAQRNHDGGRGGGRGGGSFSRGSGGNVPTTFITATSAVAPAATATAANTGTGTSGTASSSGTSTGSSSVDAALIPPFGITAGIKANDGTANCVGDGGKGIPCDCPPTLDTFVKAVEQTVAGGAAFPSGNSAADQLARLQTCIVTLQNFKGGAGSGVGCPAVSTTWKELQTKLQSETK